MEQIINACRSFRHAACLRLLKETCMRTGEVTRLQFKDFENTRKILAETNNNPRFLQIHLHSFRHFRATMLYAQTRDLLYVMKILGHRSISNTIRYTQLVDFKDGESFTCKVAKSAEDAVKLVETGFEFVSSFPDGIQLYKKRK